ncbi:MAG: methyltransferase domain-containing protein [Parvibaculum sp.]|uniref:methyltransferase domain-containing protein n=1 Tax=Parvibaculum sp. TaxID=2024848 RepID=UPI002851E446|nr:methyltransferase domain-containing protein [Parvibaculum sp.]MDR3500942.1 methyltransferase domain-containing protein [Parvibaculum sp.]
MILCPDCEGKAYSAEAGSCPSCGFKPPTIEGFDAWAPELAEGGGGFKAEYFSNLASNEEGNFWFTSRNKLILWALRKYFPRFESYLEVGCGTGYVLSGIAKEFPGRLLTGSEVFSAGLRYAAMRVPTAHFAQMDARKIPFEEEFDLVGAFDVIEHIEEDEAVFAQLYKATRQGGVLILTVPQHPWLWSTVDEHACHARRYTASQLRSRVEAAGYRILRSTSFVSVLLPAMILSRLRTPGIEDYDPSSEFRISPIVNRALTFALSLERRLIEWGVDLPFGGSRLLVAVKDQRLSVST